MEDEREAEVGSHVWLRKRIAELEDQIEGMVPEDELSDCIEGFEDRGHQIYRLKKELKDARGRERERHMTKPTTE